MSIKNSDNNYILKKLNMDIYEFSFASLDSEWKYKNALSASTRIYLPTLGEGFLDTINETIPILPGNIYLIPPMFNFSYRCENRLDKFFFQLTLEADKGFDVLQSVDKILVIKDEGECEALGKIFEKGTIEAAIQVENILFSIIIVNFHNIPPKNSVKVRIYLDFTTNQMYNCVKDKNLCKFNTK